MDKKLQGRFVVVLLIGAILLIIILSNSLGGNKNKITPNYEAEFDGFGEVKYEDLVNHDEVESETQIDEIVNDEVPPSDQTDDSFDEKNDYKSIYIEKYGLASVNEGTKVSEEAVRLWLEEETDRTKWEAYATSSFLVYKIDEIEPSMDGLFRLIQSLEVHAAEENEKNEMKFGVTATWELRDGELIINQQTRLFYITLKRSDSDKWLVKDLVEL